MPGDATQRVNVGAAPTLPVRRNPRQTAGAEQSVTRRNTATARNRRKKASQNKKITIIALAAIAAVLLIAAIIASAVALATPNDDGLILNNVYAAGVNLGGKTPEQAKALLTDSTANTYSKLDMIVDVYDSQIILSPAKTGAKLNVDAVVQAAYNYGRIGTRAERQNAKNMASSSSHVISILPYLNLNTEYIQNTVNELGNKYSSTLSQTTYRVDGKAPDLTVMPETADEETVYQTLNIKLGTSEFGLDTQKLYEQILYAYNTNIFQVVGEIRVISPEVLDLEALYKELCVAPVDATLDELTYEVTPGIYGYGFRLEELRAMLENAKDGDEIKIPMKYIRPNLTAAELTDGLFEKELATITTPASIDKNLLTNLKLVCRKINKMILKADEIFSFNEIIGIPDVAGGYTEVVTYVDKEPKEIVGGGISQVSSALYYCALQSDLKILERHNHSYAPSFIEPGLDADVRYGKMDFSFQNTTGRPIRIEAKVTDAGALQIRIWGTENKEYSVDIVYETITTYTPETLVNTMFADNPEGYLNGDVLVQPIIGYDIATYKMYRTKNTDDAPTKKLIAYSHYDKLDKVVVEIKNDDFTPPTQESNSETPATPDTSDKD